MSRDTPTLSQIANAAKRYYAIDPPEMVSLTASSELRAQQDLLSKKIVEALEDTTWVRVAPMAQALVEWAIQVRDISHQVGAANPDYSLMCGQLVDEVDGLVNATLSAAENSKQRQFFFSGMKDLASQWLQATDQLKPIQVLWHPPGWVNLPGGGLAPANFARNLARQELNQKVHSHDS